MRHYRRLIVLPTTPVLPNLHQTLAYAHPTITAPSRGVENKMPEREPELPPLGFVLVDVALAWLGDLLRLFEAIYESLGAVCSHLRRRLVASRWYAKLDWLILDWLLT
jgi:hypothetical protein